MSNLTYHSSGHIYFSVKDTKSTISCVMFRGNAQYLKFRLEVGQKIVITGNLTVYAPRGSYQLLCQKIEPSGVGALALAYEQLKAKLQIKGYFDKSVKKELPKYPKTIFIITSNTGAAIEDMKKILSNRYPLAKMILLSTIVQGEQSKENIVQNINRADDIASELENSIIIVGRGGGSIEDLWAFNEEIVADAIYSANTPIISAVGHENDFVISDFVADVRASTPSNAIEISTPNINDLRQYADSISNELNQKYSYILQNKQQQLEYLKSSFEQHSLKKRFEQIESSIKQLKIQYSQSLKHIFSVKESNISNMINAYKLNHPSKKDKKGFVQMSQNGHIIDIANVSQSDIISLENSEYQLNCKVVSKLTIGKIC